jgi:hypothetical protein
VLPALRHSRVSGATVKAIGHNEVMTSPPYVPRPVPFRSGAASPRLTVVGALVSLAGLLVVVAGSFLPWLISGGVQRNSYAVLGIVRRLAFLDGGPAATAISLWPLLGTVAMLPVIAGILRWWRTAAITTLLFGLLTGVGAAGVLAVAGGHGAAGIALSSTGPVVTITGAVLALAGAVLLLVGRRRSAQQFSTKPTGQVSAEPTDGPFRRTAHSAAPDQFPGRPPHRQGQTAPSTTAVATERENAG